MRFRSTILFALCLAVVGACEQTVDQPSAQAPSRKQEAGADTPSHKTTLPAAVTARLERCHSKDGGIESAKEGDLGSLKVCLYERIVNPNEKDAEGRTALIWASIYNHVDIARQLLGHQETNVDATDNSGMSALMHATKSNGESMVRLLLANDAAIDLTDRTGQTALMIAVRKGAQGIIEELLDEFADVDLQDEDSQTALMIATRMGAKQTVDKLIEAVVDVNLQDKYGQTALMVAAKYDHVLITEALLEGAGNPFLRNSDGHSAVDLAIKHENWLSISIISEKFPALFSDPEFADPIERGRKERIANKLVANDA